MAADQGKASAQYNMGFLYSQGQGVGQDYAQAAKWYRMAAEQGDVDSQNRLAALYLAGDGVRQDYAEAARWYRKAAEQGTTTHRTSSARSTATATAWRKTTSRPIVGSSSPQRACLEPISRRAKTQRATATWSRRE
jgi:TPR repeat protein